MEDWKRIKRMDPCTIFLFLVPYVEINDLDISKRDCALCCEPYKESTWQLDGPLNRPVRLNCGHAFGLKCLAQWMFSENFSNRCPYCAVLIFSAAVVAYHPLLSLCSMICVAIDVNERWAATFLPIDLALERRMMFMRVLQTSYVAHGSLAADEAFCRPLILLECQLERLGYDAPWDGMWDRFQQQQEQHKLQRDLYGLRERLSEPNPKNVLQIKETNVLQLRGETFRNAVQEMEEARAL